MTGERDTLQISPAPEELSRLRDFIRVRAKRHGMDATEVFQAELVATEAVTNAIRHGRVEHRPEDPITISCVWHDNGLTIEVGDRGRFRHRDPSLPEATGGRGLGLISRMTRQFDLETSESGTRLRMLIGGTT